MKTKEEHKAINIKNKKAFFEYTFLDEYVAGIALTGTEIKSIRAGNVSLQDAYCIFLDDELYVKNMNIAVYKQGTHYNHNPMRDRKLLLKKNELKKLKSKVSEKGLTIVVKKIFINNRGLAKMEIALAKGKKLHDKREQIKNRDIERETKEYF
ncbi:MAG: SsrA-binding protein [Cytophagaceae bacterium]|nr:SsrA-binding protein [Cytophagaceae bacterium]MDW8456831.1 SsrA-binding protein [Cytophagaceae bacterium]